jgi:protein-disulfide isomerase
MKTTTSKAAFLTAVLLALTLSGGAYAQNAALITAAGQKQMLNDPGTPLLGALHANITVVEYFDYNCSYCRKLAPAFGELVARDRGVAVLYKEWPIFHGVSTYAARLALATQWQGKYLQAHDALISAPRLAQEGQVDDTLRQAGIDMTRLKADLAAHGAAIDEILKRNELEANALNLRGTPGLVVGRYVVSDVDSLESLQADVAHARQPL